MFYEFFKIKKRRKKSFFSKFRHLEICFIKNLKSSQTRITLIQVKKPYTFFILDKPNLRYRVNRWPRFFGRPLFARVQWTNRFWNRKIEAQKNNYVYKFYFWPNFFSYCFLPNFKKLCDSNKSWIIFAEKRFPTTSPFLIFKNKFFNGWND